MSTAWYKPHATPKLLRSFKRRRIKATPNSHTSSIISSIEIWDTTCVVTNFGKGKASDCSILINPSNPSLLGVRKFRYFPQGRPALPSLEQNISSSSQKYEHPLMGYVRRWGDMDVKDGILYPFNVVDGIVHQLGGWRLALNCYMLPDIHGHEKCPVGYAVATSPGGRDLQKEYDSIIHTVPPFHDHPPNNSDPEVALSNCYKNALSLCSDIACGIKEDRNVPLRIASPLLGAGGRGFPSQKAVKVAAIESVRWRDSIVEGERPKILAFGIPQLGVAENLAKEISRIS